MLCLEVDRIENPWDANALMDREKKLSQDAVQLEGRYANYFKVGYNAFEFVIDFSQLYTENREPKFHTRIITSPAYAKKLLKLLVESIRGFEKAFGPISHEEDT